MVRSFIFVNIYFLVLIGFLSLFIFLFFSFISIDKWGIIASIFIASFCLGVLRFHTVDNKAPEVFETQVGQEVILSGEIIDEPNLGEDNQKLTVQIEKIQGKTLYFVKILMSTGLEMDFKYGDRINFSGILKKPENFLTDQGKIFDYINYLKKDGILYTMSYPKIQVSSHGKGNIFKKYLFDVKEKFIEKINLVIPNPESLFMDGLILGEKSAFSQSLRESFVNTGTIHVVALSGYNVTIVAEWIMKLLRRISFISENFAISVGVFTIILFIIMTGASSTAIRAGVMATLALVARATGRNYDVARALILAGVFMVLVNPMILVYDVSFQLSFIATIAVIFLAPRIEKYFTWVTEKFELRDIVSVTSAAYIFVAPFILYKMGNFSLVALPANILILPFIPFTMLLGFTTGFMGLVWHLLSIPVGFVSYLFLHYELSVIEFFSNLPFAAFTFPNFPLILTLLIYVYFINMIFGKSIKKFFVEEI